MVVTNMFIFTPGSVRFEEDVYLYSMGSNATIRCIVANNTIWQHIIFQRQSITSNESTVLYDVRNASGTLTVDTQFNDDGYSVSHASESNNFIVTLAIDAVSCSDEGEYGCATEVNDFNVLKHDSTSVRLMGQWVK